MLRKCLSQSVAALMAAGALSASCQKKAPNEEPPTNQTPDQTASIAGGVDVLPSTPGPVAQSTVALVQQTEGGEYKSFCSGTLIAQQVVLTAAHCVTHGQAFSIAFSNQINALSAAKVIAVSRAVPHAAYQEAVALDPNNQTPPNDIALVFLQNTAPVTHSPATLVNQGITIPNRVLLAGYGVTRSRNFKDNNSLRQVEVDITGASAARKTFDTGYAAFLAPQGACAGDSGGPAYVQVGGQWQLTGLLSTGGELFGFCMGNNSYTDVRYFRDWINQTSSGTPGSSQPPPSTPSPGDNGSFRGTDGNDRIDGTTNGDVIYGLAGNDTLHGLSGDDLIYGGPGDDTINGGPGNDRISGGAGNDHYIYEAGGGHDVIFDDNSGYDVLEVRGVGLDNITCRRHGEDLVVLVPQGSIRIVNHFAGEGLESVPCNGLQ